MLAGHGKLLGVLFVCTGCYFGGPPAIQQRPTDPSSELAYMYETDQSDRTSLRWLRPERDSLRLARVLDLCRQNLVVSPMDKLNAAWILHHGRDSANYRRAHELAKSAYESWVDIPHYSRKEAEWLMKATYDRWMESTGKPQKYRTQIHCGCCL
jgi:hypothetical protein